MLSEPLCQQEGWTSGSRMADPWQEALLPDRALLTSGEACAQRYEVQVEILPQFG